MSLPAMGPRPKPEDAKPLTMYASSSCGILPITGRPSSEKGIIPDQAGGLIGKLREIEIELPDYTTRRYKRAATTKRNKKSPKAATKSTPNARPANQQAGAKPGATTAEIKPKRARGKSTPQPPKTESRRAALKRSRENARKLQKPLF